MTASRRSHVTKLGDVPPKAGSTARTDLYGLAIICQKPMAPDWETARRMVEISESHGVRVMIHDNWRWQSWYRAAGAMIARGDIGTPLAYGFRTRVSHGAGDEPYPKQAYFRQLQRFMIDEVLVYHIDTARFLFGDIASIYAEGTRRNPQILAEDHVILTLRHLKGAMGSVGGHSFLKHEDSKSTMDEATFEGDAGSIRVPRSKENHAHNQTEIQRSSCAS